MKDHLQAVISGNLGKTGHLISFLVSDIFLVVSSFSISFGIKVELWITCNSMSVSGSGKGHWISSKGSFGSKAVS